jgi:hypothetical protein
MWTKETLSKLERVLWILEISMLKALLPRSNLPIMALITNIESPRKISVLSLSSFAISKPFHNNYASTILLDTFPIPYA